MYEILKEVHNVLRWFVVLSGVAAGVLAVLGTTGRRPFGKADNGVSAAFSGFLWLQVLVGLGLYFGLSPWGLNGLKTMGIHEPTVRFFAVEHASMMLLAAIIAQVGRIAVKRTPDLVVRQRKALTYFGIALFIVLLMIPWGIWNPARPLLP